MKKCYFQLFPANVGRKVAIIENEKPLFLYYTTKYPVEKVPLNQLYRYEFDSNKAYYSRDVLKSLTLLTMNYDTHQSSAKNQNNVKIKIWHYFLYYHPEMFFNSINKQMITTYLNLTQESPKRILTFLDIMANVHQDYKPHSSSIHILLVTMMSTLDSLKLSSKHWVYLLENLSGVDKNLLTKMVAVINENDTINNVLKSQFLSEIVHYVYLRKDLAASEANKTNKWTQNQQNHVYKAVSGQFKITLPNSQLVKKNVHTFLMLKKYNKQTLNETEFKQIAKLLNGKYDEYTKETLKQFIHNLRIFADKKNSKLYMELEKLDKLVAIKKFKFEVIIDASSLIFFYKNRFKTNKNNALSITPKEFSQLLQQFCDCYDLRIESILVILNRNSPILASARELQKIMSQINCNLFESNLLKDDVAMLYVAAKLSLLHESLNSANIRIYSNDHFAQYATFVNPSFSQYFDDWISSVLVNKNTTLNSTEDLLFFDSFQKIWIIKCGSNRLKIRI